MFVESGKFYMPERDMTMLEFTTYFSNTVTFCNIKMKWRVEKKSVKDTNG